MKKTDSKKRRRESPHNFRLLRRLAGYARPYGKNIMGTLCLTVVITLLDLAFPYMAKVAVDRYILSSWYIADTHSLDPAETRLLMTRYSGLLEESLEAHLFIMSHETLKKIDPAELRQYRSRGIISEERYYRAMPGALSGKITLQEKTALLRMQDNSVLIPYDRLEAFSDKDVLEIRHHDIHGVSLMGLFLILAVIFILMLGYGEHFFIERVGQNIMQDIRLRLFDRVQSQSLRFFDNNPIGRLVTRVTNDIQNLNEMFKSVIITVFKDLFLILGIMGVLLYLDLKLALVCFSLIPLVFALAFIFSTLAREAFRELRSTISKLNIFLQERITSMETIQLYAAEKHQMEKFAGINHGNFLAGMKQIRLFAVFIPIMDLGASCAVALIIWYGGGRVVQDQITLGTLIAFISYIRKFFAPIRDISEKYGVMQSAMASTERIFQFMDIREEITQPRKPVTPPVIQGHLEFREITFSYDSDQTVLHNISFEVKPGETVAVVGATGSGKTTLINLMERFYDPDKGSIFLDGVNLKHWPIHELRKSIGLVSQDVFLFTGNIHDNISLGRRDLDADAVQRAAFQANADPFIQDLTGGYDQVLGERGYNLSAGQRQLLAMARAIARETPLLILDEATSSVDPETERLIQEAVSGISSRRTTLIIAHRMSTIKHADKILVLHHGRLVEQGSHEELMALGGIYQRLNRLYR